MERVVLSRTVSCSWCGRFVSQGYPAFRSDNPQKPWACTKCGKDDRRPKQAWQRGEPDKRIIKTEEHANNLNKKGCRICKESFNSGDSYYYHFVFQFKTHNLVCLTCGDILLSIMAEDVREKDEQDRIRDLQERRKAILDGDVIA